MPTYKDLLYGLLCLSFSLIVGAAVYEHLAVWPNAYEAPPRSLTMFQGAYGLNAAAFWEKVHPVILLLYIVNLILFWKSSRRKNILLAFAGYILTMIVTLTYFVPELIDITSTEYSDTVVEGLVQRGSLWETLSLIRMVFIMLLAVILYMGFKKSE